MININLKKPVKFLKYAGYQILGHHLGNYHPIT